MSQQLARDNDAPSATSRPRVLKRYALRGEAPEKVSSGPQRRIPAQQAGGDEGPQPEVRPRVLRGAEANVLSEPFEVAEIEGTPALPLDEHDETDRPHENGSGPSWEERLAEERRQWETAREQAVAAAREEGRQAGYEEARGEMEAELERQREAFTQEAAQYLSQWQTFLDEHEPLLVELAFELAERILENPLPDDVRAVSSRALRSALDQLGENPPLVISLHPVDYLRLQEGQFIELVEATHPSVTWNPEPKLTQGDWIVQSSDETIRHLKKELARTMKRRLGLLAASQGWGADYPNEEVPPTAS